MARKPRIHFPGAVYHVMLRGNAGLPVFFGDADRSRFYLLLQESTERFGYRLHAFCCMTNHIHLAIEVGDVRLSRVMQNLSVRYTVWINHSQNRAGHLFQGRYKAILIDADSYLLKLVRYIHLNPVRAGIVFNPDEYVASGHRAYLGVDMIPWLTTDLVLSMFGPNIVACRRKYRDFVAEGVTEGGRAECHSGSYEGRVLGSADFVDQSLRKSCQRDQRPFTLEEVIEEVCLQYSMSASELARTGKSRNQSEARAMAALLVQESPHLLLTDLGHVVQRDVVAMSQAARRLAAKARNDAALANTIAQIEAALAGKVKTNT